MNDVRAQFRDVAATTHSGTALHAWRLCCFSEKLFTHDAYIDENGVPRYYQTFDDIDFTGGAIFTWFQKTFLPMLVQPLDGPQKVGIFGTLPGQCYVFV